MLLARDISELSMAKWRAPAAAVVLCMGNVQGISTHDRMRIGKSEGARERETAW
jgi:hypothetical protein